jgi:phospholipid/cholesterol/gamma-HCH transport system substrate-binding protein
VRYAGFRVGKVTSVHLSETEHGVVDVDFVVDAETPVKTDSIAYINYIGFLGKYYIEISSGTETAALLPTNSPINSRDILQISDMLGRVDSISGIIERMFETIDENVSLILTDATQLLENVNQLIGTVNQEKVRSILNNVDQIMTKNAESIGGILRNLESMLLQLDALSGSVNSIIVENETEIQETFVLMQELLRSGEATLADLEDIIGLSKDDIQQVVTDAATVSQRFARIAGELDANKVNIANMLTNLESITTNLEAFSQFIDMESGEDAKQLLDHLRASSESASLILERIQLNTDSVEAILANLATASQDASTLTAFAVERRPDFDATVQSVRGTAEHLETLSATVAGKRESLESTLAHVETASAHVENIAKQVDADLPQVSEIG